MSFCKKCGRQLADGEVCNCTTGKVPTAQPYTPQQPPQRTAPPPAQTRTPPPTQGYSTPPAQPRTHPPAQGYTTTTARVYTQPLSQPQPFSHKTLTDSYNSTLKPFVDSMKNRMGIGDPARNATDTYERDLKIVPECISENENEIPVKQYNVAIFRNLLRFERAEARMQVTNKRVILRAAGRSIGGRTTFQQEFSIDEIAGMEANRKFRFSGFFLIIGLVVVVFAALITSSLTLLTAPSRWTSRERVSNVVYHEDRNGELQPETVMEIVKIERGQSKPFGTVLVLGTMPSIIPRAYREDFGFGGGSRLARLGIIGTVLGIAFGFFGLVPFFFVKERFLLKLLTLGGSYGGFAVLTARFGIFFLFLFISVLVVIFGLILYCMRPDLTIIVKNKGAIEQSPPIAIKRTRSFWSYRQDTGTGYSEVLPTPESEAAIREIGAIINDIQKLGDHGVQKWLK